MNYICIKNCDIINSLDGVAVSLWVSGCSHHCEGCFNKETWSYDSGNMFDDKAFDKLSNYIDSKYVNTFSVLGGEPFAPKNIDTVLSVINTVRQNYPDKIIMVWTGYKIEDIIKNYDLSSIDYVIDGKFELDNPTKKKLRGSDNQRMIKIYGNNSFEIID